MARPAAFGRRPLATVAERQDGVLTRHQLRDHGYDESAVRSQLIARRWQRFGRKVIVLHNGALTLRQRWWVAVLSQHRAALAGATAATGQGLAVHLWPKRYWDDMERQNDLVIVTG